jgi:hypothetical protein
MARRTAMMRLRQIYCLGWVVILAVIIVAGHADSLGRFLGSAITAWVVYSVPFGITFVIARSAKKNAGNSED